MNVDFEVILTLVTIFFGVIYLSDIVLGGRKTEPQRSQLKLPLLIDYARSFFPILLLVWLVRSFVVQPYRVPTGSLEPTIVPGDFILVSEFAYGLRLPVWGTELLSTNNPKHGEIVLFRWPVNPKVTFVKRLIGLPGDHISYLNKVLYINGKKMSQTYRGPGKETSTADSTPVSAQKYQENLFNVKHDIYVRNDRASADFRDLVVPQNAYFVMGDNRDDSDDSRDWGFVPQKDLIGRALFIWLSWDSNADWKHKIRWDRVKTDL